VLKILLLYESEITWECVLCTENLTMREGLQVDLSSTSLLLFRFCPYAFKYTTYASPIVHFFG
jgi:hypothetical protein